MLIWIAYTAKSFSLTSILSIYDMPILHLDIVSVKDGHKTRKFDLKDTEDINDLCEVVKEKLGQGWILYGGKKQGDLKKLLEGRNVSKNEIKEVFKDKDKSNLMLDSPHDSDEESVFYERAMLAAPVAGG